MTDIDHLTAKVDALAARLDEVEAENRVLRHRLEPTAPSPTTSPAPGRFDRRRLLRDGAIAGAAATAAVVAGGAQPVAAADGDEMIAGEVNTAETYTSLQTNDAAGFLSFTGPNPTILDHIWGSVAGYQDSSNVNSFGVIAHAGPSSTAGLGTTGPIGAVVRSNLTHLRLGPITASTRQAPVFDPIAHQAGDIVRTSAGEIWWCTTDGTPGQWVKLGGPTTAGSLHLLPAPVRVYDSRPGTTPSQGPKTPLPAGNVARTIDMTANNSGVPKSLTASGGRFAATGVLLNVLLVNAAAGNGNLTVWANDQPKPQSNTLVWGGSDGRFSTLAVTGVDTEARVKIDSSLQTNVVIDVVGYYR